MMTPAISSVYLFKMIKDASSNANILAITFRIPPVIASDTPLHVYFLTSICQYRHLDGSIYSYHEVDLKRFVSLAIFVISILIPGCRIYERVVSKQFKLVSVQKHDLSMTNIVFADLNNDNIDEVVSSDSNQGKYFSIYIGDSTGKIFSQINLRHEIQTIRVLSNPKDNKSWLFYSFNDGENVRLMSSHYTWGRESKREDKRFAPIARIFREGENKNSIWNGQFYPEFIRDTDGDGREELVCRALCGFQANPRGLVVFDFETGELEWYYRIPSNINSILFDDFDGNGDEEFIFATVAVKNTEMVLNGIDDMNGYIVVLDRFGKLIWQDQHFPGYGEGFLETKVNNTSGMRDIYRTIVTWGAMEYNNSVSIMNFTGKKLVKKKGLDLAKTLERSQLHGFMEPMDRDGSEQVFLLDKERGLIVMDETLSPIKHKYKGFVKYIWDVRDLDLNGDKEYLLETEDGYFEILDHKLRVRARIKSPEPAEPNIRLMTFSPGFGKDARVALCSPTITYYYDIVNYPIYRLIDDTLKAYVWYICVALILSMIFTLWLYKSRTKVYQTATNDIELGFLIVRGKDRIVFASRYVRNLILTNMEDESIPSFRSLKQYLPNVYIALMEMLRAGERSTHLKLRIHIGKLDEDFKCTITKRSPFLATYLIILSPVTYHEDGVKEKLEWADIARRLSHNVRRHITNVVLAMEPLTDKCSHDEKTSRYLELIRNEVELIRVFTHSFQRFTELEDYDLKVQDVIPIVDHCLNHTPIPANIHLMCNWGETPIPALIEPIRLEEAVSNIINNAIEAMQGGGVLHIGIKSFDKQGAGPDNQSVLIEIEDNGYGIPSIYLEDIYKPFFTTKQSGTGIGIPESHKIIKSMHGNLQIQSSEGVGTTVSIWLKGHE